MMRRARAGEAVRVTPHAGMRYAPKTREYVIRRRGGFVVCAGRRAETLEVLRKIEELRGEAT
jgi:hypothetical protein